MPFLPLHDDNPRVLIQYAWVTWGLIAVCSFIFLYEVSMTPNEREDPKIIDPSRRNRIATGAGVPASEVNDLVKQFDAMKQIMVGMAGKGIGERMKMARQLQDSGMFNHTAVARRV